jgi:hypothetical protein
MSEKTVRKRNKPSLVCGNCKKKKIKCDRKLPCLACVRTNLGYGCSYGDEPKQPQDNTGDKSIYWELLKLRERVKELEQIQGKNINADQNNSINSGSEGNSAYKPSFGTRTDFNGNTDEPIFTASSDTTPSTRIPHTTYDDASSRYTLSIQSSFNNTPPSTGSNITYHPNNHPIVSYKHIISFYEGCIPIQIKGKIKRANYGPLTIAAIMKGDPWLCLHWKHMESQANTVSTSCILTQQLPPQTQENDNLYGKSSAEPDKNGVVPESTFFKKSLENEGYGEIIPYKSLQKKINAEILNSNTTFNITNLTLARSLFDGRGHSELQLIEKIESILPSKKVIWCLINRFFRKLYPFFPFLDEQDFKEELVKILGHENCKEDYVKIEKKLDLVNVCICLILLRLTYLSLFSNINSENEQALESEDETEEKFLLSNPINLVTIDIARSCVQSLQSTKKYNLTLFQAILFMRIYTIHAPEEGDGMDGGDSQVKTGVLINVAYLLGFNREPNKFNDVCNNEKVNNICRKIWYYLIKTDVLQAYMGTPFGIDMNHFDTLLPYLSEESKNGEYKTELGSESYPGNNCAGVSNTLPMSNSNVSNLEMERVVIDSFKLHSTLSPLREVLKMVLDMTKGTSVNTLTEGITKVENVCKEQYEVILSQSKGSFDRVWRVQLFLYFKSFLLSIYLHLFLYYERLTEVELSFYFLALCHDKILTDILPFFSEILTGELSQFGFIMNPILQITIHKCIQFVLLTATRVSYQRYSMGRDEGHQRKLESVQYQQQFQAIEQFAENSIRTGELMIRMFDKLSSRYFYSWRLKNIMKKLFQHAADDELYKDVPQSVKDLNSLNFSTSQLRKLNELIKDINRKVDCIVNKKREDVPENVFIPASSGEIPLDPGSNEYIDQMWMLMMAMKDTNFQSKFIPEEQAILNTKLHFKQEDPDFQSTTTPGPTSPYLQLEGGWFDIFNVFPESSWE